MSKEQSSSRIRDYRRSAGLSLQAFGEQFDPPYHKTSILRWERDGVPSDLRTILAIEAVTGIPRTQLVPEFFDLSTIPEVSSQ